MARTRRRMARPPGRARRPSRRADWVYRSNTFDTAGALFDDLGTYAPQYQTLVANSSLAGVLYDSHNYTATKVRASGAGAQFFPAVWAPARAEGRRAFIHRVVGTMFVTPSNWAIGSQFQFGIRFGIFEQDAAVGAFLIDPNYNMLTAGALAIVQPALWANDRKWQHERRVHRTFTDNSTIFEYRFAFSVRRSLAPNECYGFYMENPAAETSTIASKFWFRTLVSDEA